MCLCFFGSDLEPKGVHFEPHLASMAKKLANEDHRHDVFISSFAPFGEVLTCFWIFGPPSRSPKAIPEQDFERTGALASPSAKFREILAPSNFGERRGLGSAERWEASPSSHARDFCHQSSAACFLCRGSADLEGLALCCCFPCCLLDADPPPFGHP